MYRSSVPLIANTNRKWKEYRIIIIIIQLTKMVAQLFHPWGGYGFKPPNESCTVKKAQDCSKMRPNSMEILKYKPRNFVLVTPLVTFELVKYLNIWVPR